MNFEFLLLYSFPFASIVFFFFPGPMATALAWSETLSCPGTHVINILIPYQFNLSIYSVNKYIERERESRVRETVRFFLKATI